MAKKKIKISELSPATSLAGFSTLGYKIVDGKKTSVRLDLSHVQTAYEKTVDATKDANEAAGKADKAADRLNELSDHRDKVVDGYWWSWNEKEKKYFNTGEIAKGNVMYATFNIDPATGNLEMTTPNEYTGPDFSLDKDGNLCVTINE